VKRQEDNIDFDRNSFEYFKKLEKSLATKLGLSELKSGIQVIRDNQGWRENEKSIKYIWIVTIARSFVGWGGLFAIQFNENKFREHLNQEELLQGLFISTQDGVGQIYTEQSLDVTSDVSKLFRLNLFESNNGVTLDGVSYKIRIIAPNIDTFIQLNNPNSEEWKKWESEIWAMGKKLARKSNDQEMIHLFE
jgi:hypothetical protein